MTDTLARRSSRALRWSWAGALLRASMQFAAQVVLARLLGPEAVGQAAVALLVIGLASLVAEAGLGAALVQRPALADADAGLACGWVLAVSAVVAGAVALAAGPLAALLGDRGLQPLVLAAACIVPLQAFTALPSALLQREFSGRRLLAVQLSAYAVGYGLVGVGLAWAGAGAWSLLAAFAVHAVVVAWLAARACAVSWVPRWSGPQVRSMLSYGARTTAANLVNWALESLDRLWLSRLAGSTALGAYTVAATLSRAPVTLLVGATQPVAFASAARLHDQGDRVARGYLAVVSLAVLLALPMFTWLAWFAEPVVLGLYGPAWAPAVAPFAWLCLGVPFFVMLALTGPLLRGLDAVGAETRSHAVVLGLLALALWLAWRQPPAEPLTVVAALTTLACGLRAAALSWALSRRIGLSPWAAWGAWRGGVVLAALTVATAALTAWVAVPTTLAAVLTAAVMMALVIVLLRLGAAPVLLHPALRTALLNRRGDSPLVARLCGWARLG